MQGRSDFVVLVIDTHMKLQFLEEYNSLGKYITMTVAD